MQLPEFKASLAEAAPPAGLPDSLKALWQAAKGNWAAAHNQVQQREGEQACDWIHAYLHRQEGDPGNAGYWYRRAGKPFSNKSLEEEWAEIAAAILSGLPE